MDVDVRRALVFPAESGVLGRGKCHHEGGEAPLPRGV